MTEISVTRSSVKNSDIAANKKGDAECIPFKDNGFQASKVE